jgi:Zn-dependent M16 (insulinase) family peptidase
MSDKTTYPEPTLKEGEASHGFVVLRVQPLPSIRITAYELEHIETGAKLLHLHAFDRENLFAICFRTPPPDASGVPHILEHSVLAGSQKYPLKDVFKELIRSTMQTFVNAFTYPDKTIYPVASQIKSDFFNLARVYTDLVFHPRMLKETFLQEGHHLEFTRSDDITSDLTISGIVYNEMRGAYSSPDTLMYKLLQENVYPDTVYAFDSGGDPDVIPSLTYEQFKDYHRRYYSPSNARFFIYGNIETVEHLAFLSEALAGFGKTSIHSSIDSQKRFPEPRIVRGTYPLGKEESSERKTMVNVAWMLCENTEDETSLALEITSALLVGSAASPLRKALIDSGLGEDLTPVTGLEGDLKQLMFCVGLRNTRSADAQKIEKLILDTLEKIAEEGYETELIEGVLHQVEFHGKEIVRGSYPYGIILMNNVFQTWLYDGDPFIGLDFPRIIETIRARWKEDPCIFQKITRQWLLENKHRVTAIMEPDVDFNDKKERAYREAMARLKASLSESQLLAINEQAKKLKEYQSEPDTPEAAAMLPKIKIKDIPRKIETIPNRELSIDAIKVLEHDLFTNGIAYVDLVFDVSHIPEELQIYLPLLGKILTGMGAAGHSYEEMAKRIALKMGGFGYNLTAGFSADGASTWQKMIFSFKALYRNLTDAFDIVSDVVYAADLTHEPRMKDLISERKNALQSAIIPSGHLFAKTAAGAALTLPGYRDEQWHGRTQFKFVQTIAGKFPKLKDDFREKLDTLRHLLFRRQDLIINITADTQGLDKIKENIRRIAGKLPPGKKTKTLMNPDLKPVYAGISVPSQVSYVAYILKTPAYTDPISPYLVLASKDLSNNYLYKHIRVQGGAYGGMSSFDTALGLFAFLSYRDPHIAQTLTTFKNARDYYLNHELSEDDLEKAIISSIALLDRPTDPAGRGYLSLMRYLGGVTDEMRQQFRDAILSATPKKVKDALEDYFSSSVKAAVAIVSSPEKLKEANQELKPKLHVEHLFQS